ncbi:MAG TPA: protein kinase [Bryobacteraceae bacterium]|jgi:serine/threonine protein kinase/Tol biopolymer transport system component|nr:protein kinase [Bryobacteraceae bacterium]
MELKPGDKLGPYEIVSPIGKGGMGEVWRARDPRLGRDVAIKVSAQQFTDRFEVEARAIAALNHSNICTLYDVGTNYLVMELIEGPTLADRIAEGPVPLEEALAMAKQIADAMQAAHERGIVHRDLKPANIKIRPDGSVKVLDFGLAKAGEPKEVTPDSPTMMPATSVGMIMGTAGYMSPEQARGKEVDKRADIWAFGVVVYEMLTGEKVFDGPTLSDALASVLTKEPDLDRVPPKARRLVRSCLQKDSRKRLQDIGDAQLLLEDLPAAPATEPSTRPARRINRLWPAAAALLAVALLALVIYDRRTPPPGEISRFQISIPENMAFAETGFFALSPDGRKVAFQAVQDHQRQIWIRPVDSLEAHPLPGTTNAFSAPFFWSPDSRFVVFEADKKLRKIDINGGPPQDICDVPSNLTLGGSWNRDNIILFGAGNGSIFRVSAAGGTASPVTAVDRSRKETGHYYPTFLPDGNHFLYMSFPEGNANASVYVGSLDAKPEQQSKTPLFTTARASISWVPSAESGTGRVLFWRDNVLFARTFNNRGLMFEGEPRAIADQVGYSLGPAFAMFSATANRLVYRRGTSEDLELTWLDRGGKAIGTVGDAGRYDVLHLSPDGTRIAVSKFDPVSYNTDIWLVDLRSGANTRFTFDPAYDSNPVWSPDGKRVIFVSTRGGTPGLYEKSTEGAGTETVLLRPIPAANLTDWSRDGRYVISFRVTSDASAIWVLPLEGDRKPFPFLRSNFSLVGPRLSPDGRWIAFRSNESGRDEIYVESFTPAADAGSAPSTGKWLVSRGNSAGMIHWRQDGRELYYLSLDGTVMAVPVTANPGFHAGPPEPLFKVPAGFDRAGPLGEVSPDGQRFLLALPKGGAARQEFTVVTNWDSVSSR